MSQSNEVEIVIPAGYQSILSGVTHAGWTQLLKFELNQTGEPLPTLSGRLVGKGMQGESMLVEGTTDNEKRFPAIPCGSTLKLSATYNVTDDGEEMPSKVLHHVIPHEDDESVLVLFAEDGGVGAKDIDYNDVTARLHLFK